MIRGLIKAGIAKKLYDEARKPHNQAKIRALIDQARNRGGTGGTTTRRAGRPH